MTSVTRASLSSARGWCDPKRMTKVQCIRARTHDLPWQLRNTGASRKTTATSARPSSWLTWRNAKVCLKSYRMIGGLVEKHQRESQKTGQTWMELPKDGVSGELIRLKSHRGPTRQDTWWKGKERKGRRVQLLPMIFKISRNVRSHDANPLTWSRRRLSFCSNALTIHITEV